METDWSSIKIFSLQVVTSFDSLSSILSAFLGNGLTLIRVLRFLPIPKVGFKVSPWNLRIPAGFDAKK